MSAEHVKPTNPDVLWKRHFARSFPKSWKDRLTHFFGYSRGEYPTLRECLTNERFQESNTFPYIFVSSSLRKGFLLCKQLEYEEVILYGGSDFTLPDLIRTGRLFSYVDDALEQNKIAKKRFPNGNNYIPLQKFFFLGFSGYHPVFIVSAEGGETSENDNPGLQAQNKAKVIQGEIKSLGASCIVFAADSVLRVDQSVKQLKHVEHLGKPNIPSGTNGDKDVQKILRAYVETHFQVNTVVTHLTGLFVQLFIHGQELNHSTISPSLIIFVTKELLQKMENVRYDHEAAGAGFFQNAIQFEGEFQQLSRIQQIYEMYQILGVPFPIVVKIINLIFDTTAGIF